MDYKIGIIFFILFKMEDSFTTGEVFFYLKRKNFYLPEYDLQAINNYLNHLSSNDMLIKEPLNTDKRNNCWTINNNYLKKI